jgi:hypothetical protein
MICDVRQRSVEHFEHRKWDVWPLRNLPSGGMTGPVEGSAGVGAARKGFEDVDEVEIFESVLSVLDWRDLRRKGMDGRRKVGKTEGTE